MSGFITAKTIASAKVLLGKEAKVFNSKKLAQAEKYTRYLLGGPTSYVMDKESFKGFDIIKYVKGKKVSIGSVTLDKTGRVVSIKMDDPTKGVKFYASADTYISKTSGKEGNHITISRIGTDVTTDARGIIPDLHQINLFL